MQYSTLIQYLQHCLPNIISILRNIFLTHSVVALSRILSLSLSRNYSVVPHLRALLSLNPNLIVVVPVNYSHSARILPYIDGISVELSNDKTRSNIISLLFCTPAVTVTVTVTKTKTKNRNHDQNVNDGVTPTEAGVVAS